MTMEPKKRQEHEEKQWENPLDPAVASDERDKEQLLRQYKEARRLKDNLTDDQENTDKKNTN